MDELNIFIQNIQQTKLNKQNIKNNKKIKQK